MPGFYPEDEYDLAGFSVGVVDRAKILDRERVQAGDVLIALPSSGLHSNGFSLVRRVFDVENRDLSVFSEELGMRVGEALLTPTRIYVKPILALMEKVRVRSVCHLSLIHIFIFHEACGHSLEATAVAFGNSEFAGKLGQQIASPIVTAIDDGTMENEWGSINIDDEGNPATRLVLIENGILKNYMVDRLNGRRMGMPVTGSARRQNYAYAPTSRMRNTFIAPGNDDEAEIISSMGDGLYAKAMGGGSVNPRCV